VVPRIRLVSATQPYRRNIDDHPKPSARYRAIGERAGGRLCSTELHHH
jgi:hypothetical protein